MSSAILATVSGLSFGADVLSWKRATGKNTSSNSTMVRVGAQAVFTLIAWLVATQILHYNSDELTPGQTLWGTASGFFTALGVILFGISLSIAQNAGAVVIDNQMAMLLSTVGGGVILGTLTPTLKTGVVVALACTAIVINNSSL
jgi:hypothetical protein